MPKAFDEIHLRKNMLVGVKGNSVDDAGTYSIQAAFAKANGVSEADFKREYNGFAVNTSMKRADELTRKYGPRFEPPKILRDAAAKGAPLG